MIIGIDEVGRGCLAGPVCVAAVSLDGRMRGLGDSKLIPAPQRRKLARQIKRRATFVGIGWATAREVETHNVVGALRLAAWRALAGLDMAQVTEMLLDGNHNYLGDPRVRTIIKGDAKVPAISAASIVAKVARDAYMQAMHAQYPDYGFMTHVGYATTQHRQALQLQGPCSLHRMSFGMLKEMAALESKGQT